MMENPLNKKNLLSHLTCTHTHKHTQTKIWAIEYIREI